MVIESLLDCFDPKVTLYYYEPGFTTEPPSMSSLPMLMTVPPNKKRYHQVKKLGSVEMMYMPTYALDELLSVGDHLHLREKIPKGQFTQSDIEARYHEFGGIIRYILANTKKLDTIRRDAAATLHAFDPKQMLRLNLDVGQENVSPDLMQINVERIGLTRFRNYNTLFVSDKVRIVLEAT